MSGLLDPANNAGPRLPWGGTPFHILFGRDARSKTKALVPALDGDALRTGLDNFVAGKYQIVF